MDEQRPTPASPQPATAVLRRRRGPPLVWLVPLVALLIGAWLVWTTQRERGPTATIAFETAEGLEPGKTRVRYRDVDVGTVEGVEVAPDLSGVRVTVRMVRSAAGYLNRGTRFWVVKPRLGLGGVSGLGTLVSGAYIGVDPGQGEPTAEFNGLEEPPLVRSTTPGRRFALTADRLGGLGPGAAISYRGIKVGEVLGYDFTEDWQALTIPIFIHSPYDRLVRPNSRFWNASGIEVSLGSGGPAVSVESLQALATGGVSFDTPALETGGLDAAGEPAEEGTQFPLYANQRAAGEARFTHKVSFLVYFDGSVRGLHPGSAVEFRGIKIGEVTDVRLAWDPGTQTVRIPVTLGLEPERIEAGNGMPGTGQPPVRADEAIMVELVKRGLRAQLRTGNLLTGELIVAFDFFPGAPPAKLERSGDMLELPSQANVLDAATRTATDLMNELANAPIAETVTELRNTIRMVGALVGSPDVQQSVAALRGALGELERTSRTIGGEAAPTIQALRQVAERTATLVTQAERTLESTERVVSTARPAASDLQGLIRELTSAARSIRGLTDYLERHPEALIRGKGG